MLAASIGSSILDGVRCLPNLPARGSPGVVRDMHLPSDDRVQSPGEAMESGRPCELHGVTASGVKRYQPPGYSREAPAPGLGEVGIQDGKGRAALSAPSGGNFFYIYPGS